MKLTLTTELKQPLLHTKTMIAQEAHALVQENQPLLLQEADLRKEEVHLHQKEERLLQTEEVHLHQIVEVLPQEAETTEDQRNLNNQTAEKVAFLTSLDLAKKPQLLLQASAVEDLLQPEVTTLTAFPVLWKKKEVSVSAG